MDAGLSDDLTQSVDYSAACKSVQKACPTDASDPRSSMTAYELADRIVQQCLSDIALPISLISAELELPKAVLRAKAASVRISRRRDGSLADHTFIIKDLPVHTVVGIHPHEREDKQPVVVNLTFSSTADFKADHKINFARLERCISDFIEASAFLTVEALTSEVAERCFSWLENPESYTVTVSIAKPSALRMADAPEITITRALADSAYAGNSISSIKSSEGKVLAAIALGANLGDRFQNIELALRYLDTFHDTLHGPELPMGYARVVDTSFLYETTPMYVESQPNFINCACLVETTLSTLDLLRVCKLIEVAVGRVPGVRFGPRTVDLDVVTYGTMTFDTRAEDDRSNLDNLEGHLVVPHPRMSEREFVLRPLKDILPEWVHPQLKLPVRSLLSKLMLAKDPKEAPMLKVVPFPDTILSQSLVALNAPRTKTYWVLPELKPSQHCKFTVPRRRYVMATLNVTPDSFSDGSEHYEISDALKYVHRSVSEGAEIIDIGGYSTRPGAAFVSLDEEISRVVPVIKAIRCDEQLRDVLISVDTFRVEVARAAVEAGANCINDVYAFSGPAYPPTVESDEHFQKMKELARRTTVPVILTHSRGDGGSNKDYSMYRSPHTSKTSPVLEGIRTELGTKVERAVEGEGGIRRWQVFVDPGIGFSKTVEGNVDILRECAQLTTDCARSPHFSDQKPSTTSLSTNWNPLAGFPLLIGTSRKSFLGSIISQAQPQPGVSPSTTRTDRPAKERDFATAAAITCAIQQGAAVVRVHEVQGMVDVIRVAAALWP